ncbi:MAG TPA: hypothetical protein VF104_04310 [Burkholderiales bacterium]
MKRLLRPTGLLLLLVCEAGFGQGVPAPSPPGMPQVPQVPQMPQSPQVPQIPQMPRPGAPGMPGTAPGMPPRAGFPPSAMPGVVAPTVPARSREFPLPAPTTQGKLALGVDGNIYVALTDANRIARLDPRTGAFQQWPLPGVARPRGLTLDRQGVIWYAGTATVGRLNPVTGQVRDYPLPAGPPTEEITSDPRNMIWFTRPDANLVGRLDPDSGLVKEMPVPARPRSIIADRAGNIWLTLAAQDKMLVFNTNSDAWRDVQLPSGLQPSDIALGPDGTLLWLTGNGARTALGYDTAAGRVYREYQSPIGGGGIGLVASDGRGLIWLVNSASNTLVRMDTRTGTSQPLSLSNPSPGIQDILIDQAGRLWYLAIGNSRLGVVE